MHPDRQDEDYGRPFPEGCPYTYKTEARPVAYGDMKDPPQRQLLNWAIVVIASQIDIFVNATEKIYCIYLVLRFYRAVRGPILWDKWMKVIMAPRLHKK